MMIKRILLIFLSAVLLTGCWDKIEIDRRLLVSLIAIDAGKDIKKEKELKSVSPEAGFGERQAKKLNVIFGFPDISQIEPGKSGMAEDKFIKTEAISMTDSISEVTMRSSRVVNLGHTRLLVLGSDFLGHPQTVKEVLDFLERVADLNKTMYVVVTEGKTEDILLNYKPSMEKNIENYIQGLMQNSHRNAAIFPITLGEVIRTLSDNGNAIIPSIRYNKEQKQLEITGVAAVKDYTFKGYLTPVELANIEMMRGKLRGGKRVIFEEGHPVDMEIDRVDRTITVTSTPSGMRFDVNIRLDGQISEYYIGGGKLTEDKIKRLEGNFSRSISQECNETAKIIQKEFNIDPVGFNNYVEKYHPSLWENIKGKWDEVYKAGIISAKVDVRIRRKGILQ